MRGWLPIHGLHLLQANLPIGGLKVNHQPLISQLLEVHDELVVIAFLLLGLALAFFVRVVLINIVDLPVSDYH